ncbi:MAG: hypothetical protein A3C70_00225 [Candidatus Zambryskibacteria bacterium RIFCSPHIGHO2_02_FULL_43_14]|uniref:Uncharacterized protein n=1 Tax=Candidatus Zambryskibacteria bacterium RIFCSPHIGHO2_02_FULL_43_14 TaxID=1802748 RepID=A0A1G2TEZ6_9BACT|nr:MAG: hypothetical protein A2829_03275 [Candidatus Zambryskibacteria bacterium RIFCSPHIGHO2_01_FULL_43_60]OHA95874.1 MAG: hypothetical protein A3C70_00225 [Candidatus Zambryskibacteria bacterium RIFCSPHIGHO2_02_FULL_43_14]OHB03411.1 MAG: hypothetical protein A3B03_02410 [Candidatus Zambryskibacteria bacterium RIFCSPLOWO2_01_FULL_42_41]
MKISPKMELAECAEALLKLNLSAPIAEFEKLIDTGYHFLEGLKASSKCNPSLVSALDYRIKRAENLLEQKKQLETAS